MRGAVRHGPFFHGLGDRVGHMTVQRLVLVNGLLEGLVNVGGKRGSHHAVVKDQRAENFIYLIQVWILLSEMRKK